MWWLSMFYLPIYLFLYHAEKHILVFNDFTTVFILVEYKYLHYNSAIFLFLLKILRSILMQIVYIENKLRFISVVTC